MIRYILVLIFLVTTVNAIDPVAYDLLSPSLHPNTYETLTFSFQNNLDTQIDAIEVIIPREGDTGLYEINTKGWRCSLSPSGAQVMVGGSPLRVRCQSDTASNIIKKGDEGFLQFDAISKNLGTHAWDIKVYSDDRMVSEGTLFTEVKEPSSSLVFIALAIILIAIIIVIYSIGKKK